MWRRRKKLDPVSPHPPPGVDPAPLRTRVEAEESLAADLQSPDLEAPDVFARRPGEYPPPEIRPPSD